VIPEIDRIFITTHTIHHGAYVHSLPRAAVQIDPVGPDDRWISMSVAKSVTSTLIGDYISEKIWRPFGMEADASWIVDKAGIERGGCCLSITLRHYARLGMFMDEGGRAGGVDVLADGWIHEAWRPQPSEPNKYTVGYGQARQDGGYEAVGAYGQSVTIYPEEHLVIAVNSASVDPHGIGLARWDLIAVNRGAVRLRRERPLRAVG